MNYGSLTPITIKGALDRDGEMSRLKAQSGIRISSSPCVSTYIIERKIRRILEHYAKGVTFKSARTIDRLINKLDVLEKVDLEYLHHVGTEESVDRMISTLKMTNASINSIACAWKERGKQ